MEIERGLKTDEICKFMPKVELHAHLNGSITEAILSKLKSGKDSDPKNPNWGKESRQIKTLEECWPAFAAIHEQIKTPEMLYLATQEVIGDFAKDQVIYLELRTTPKKIHSISSKDCYIETVVNAIIASRSVHSDLVVKLILSIDRRSGPEDGLENIRLLEKWLKWYPDVIAGLDISGDPTFGSHKWIVPLLEEARLLKIPISCHLPEVINVEEMLMLMRFRPERVAHGVYLHPSCGGTEELWQIVKDSQVPVEVCITSNVVTGISSSIEEHYVKLLHTDNIPYVICTDDSGVFETTLSEEYKRYLNIVPLSIEELKRLSVRSVDFAFTTEIVKSKIKDKITHWWAGNQRSFET